MTGSGKMSVLTHLKRQGRVTGCYLPSALSPVMIMLISVKKKVMVCFYIAQYPVRWTSQSALHFSSPGRPVHSDTNSTSPGSILARQQLSAKTKSLTFPPLSIARYSFIQLSVIRSSASKCKKKQKEGEPTNKTITSFERLV